MASDWAWRLIVVAAAAALFFYVVVRLRLVVIPVIGALFLATLMVPPTALLRRLGFGRMAAAGVVFFGSIAILSMLLSFLVPQIVGELGQFGDVLSEGVDEAASALESTFGIDEDQVREFADGLQEGARENARPILRGVLEGALTASEIIAGLVLTIFLSFFFVADGERMGQAVLGFFNAEQRRHVSEMASRAWATLGAYLRGIALIAMVDAVAIGTGLAIIGVPLVLPLALVVFVGAFLPLVGAFSAGALAVLVALVTNGVVNALIVLALIVAVQQLEGHILTPLVLGRATQLHPVMVILSLTAGAVVGGIFGAFVAVPTAAVISAIAGYWRSPASDPPDLATPVV